MFDAARIRSAPATEQAGYAGAEGTVYGITTVSVTGVTVIGEPKADVAVNVDFGEHLPSAWFQPSLVEVMESPALTLTIGGTRLKREVDGTWEAVRKPWWRFW